MPNILKKLVINEVKAIDDINRTIDFTGTTEAMDRGQESILCDGWQTDNYVKNPIILWAHDYRSPPIGKCLQITKTPDKKMVFRTQFATAEIYPFADTIYKLCKAGFINATSVGFIPIEWKDSDAPGQPWRTYTKQELLELSIVPVPANAEALRNALDSTFSGKISQDEIADEIDYLFALVKGKGLNDSNRDLIISKCKELGLRLPGSDKPDVIPETPVQDKTAEEYLAAFDKILSRK